MDGTELECFGLLFSTLEYNPPSLTSGKRWRRSGGIVFGGRFVPVFA